MANLGDADVAYVQSTYTSQDMAAHQARQVFIRPSFETSLSKVIDDSSLATSYGTGVGIWTGAPILIAFVILGYTIFLVCCRCFCGSCKPKCSILPWLIAGISASVLIASFSSMGTAYNVRLTDVQKDLSKHSLTLIDDANAKISRVQVIIASARLHLPQVVNNVTGLLGSVSVSVDTWLRSVQHQADFASGVVAIDMSGLTASVTPIRDALQNINDAVQETLIDRQADIDSAIADVESQLNEVSNKTTDARSQAVDIIDWVDWGDAIRSSFMYALFSVLLVASVSTYSLAVLFPRLKLVYLVSMAVTVPVFFLATLIMSVHVLVPLVLGDACLLADEKETSNDVVLACLARRNLVDAFNYTNEVEFRDRIVFPDEAYQQFNFSAVYEFCDTGEALGITNMSVLRNDTLALEQNLRATQLKLLNVSDVAAPLFEDADALINEANCDFLADFYGKTKYTLCNDAVSATGLLALALFFTGIVGGTIFSLSNFCLLRKEEPKIKYTAVKNSG